MFHGLLPQMLVIFRENASVILEGSGIEWKNKTCHSSKRVTGIFEIIRRKGNPLIRTCQSVIFFSN